MPIEKMTNKEGEQVNRYVAPFVIRTTDMLRPEHWQVIRDHRRVYAQQVEQLAALQKQFGKEKDYENAKAVKEWFHYFVQAEKAATLVLNYLEKPEENIARNDYPVDLATMMDYEFHAAYTELG
jgi:hypothetical protein